MSLHITCQFKIHLAKQIIHHCQYNQIVISRKIGHGLLSYIGIACDRHQFVHN